MEQAKGTWDKGVPYDVIQNKLLNELKKAKSDLQKCYISILLIQLRNGSRISEAIRAYKQYLMNRERKQMVKLSKQRQYAARLMIIPDGVYVCHDLLEVDDKRLRERIRSFIRKIKIGGRPLNTHSLRYSFITKLLMDGVDSAIVSKITGHKNLNHMITYTQSKIAEKILEKVE